MRKSFHHVIVDGRQCDAELKMYLAVGFLLEAVHREDTRGLLGELCERDFQHVPGFTSVYGHGHLTAGRYDPEEEYRGSD